MNDLGVTYDFEDMDILDEDEKQDMKEKVKECNPKLSYPTLKIDDKCISGYKENEIREVLE